MRSRQRLLQGRLTLSRMPAELAVPATPPLHNLPNWQAQTSKHSQVGFVRHEVLRSSPKVFIPKGEGAAIRALLPMLPDHSFSDREAFLPSVRFSAQSFLSPSIRRSELLLVRVRSSNSEELSFPKALWTHVLKLLSPKTITCRLFGLC